MAKRIPWDIYEAVLLVDAYYLVKEGCLDRKMAVCILSEELRRKALNSNLAIDDVFRNTNGINMRLYEIQYIDTGGKTGMKNTSKLFVETVEIYHNSPDEFYSLLQEAKRQVGYSSQRSEQSFMFWLEDHVYAANRVNIEIAFRVVDNYARKMGLITGNFDALQDHTQIEEIVGEVANNTRKTKSACSYDFDGLLQSHRTYAELLRNEKGRGAVEDKCIDNDVKAKGFSKWLIDEMKLATATARGYSSAINTATPHAQEICGIKGSIYDIDDLEELQKVLKTMMSDDGFIVVNSQSHNRFRGAFDKYMQYMKEKAGDTSYESILKNSEDEGSFDDVEEIIREADIDGITASAISTKIGKSIWLVNKHLKTQAYAVEIPGDVYIHVDNIIDIHENKDAIQKIIEAQFLKFNGYTNDVVLMDAAMITLGMFLNDNCIDTPEKMYGIARFLFEKEEAIYYFAGDKHIWKVAPKYSTTYAGVLMGFIASSGGRATKVQCAEYLQKVKLSSNNINGLLSIATSKDVLFYGNEEYVLADVVVENETWLNRFKNQIEKLFKQAAYIIPREISENWFELLPTLYGGMFWNLPLLQDLIKKYLPEYRLITANENQGLETIRAGIVLDDSLIGNFADLVYARLLEDPLISLPIRIDKEEFRQKLIEYKMIQGSELIYTMPKAVAGAKFAWSGDGESVLILKN